VSVADHRLEVSITLRTLLIATAIVGVTAALVSIKDALIVVFVGVFLAHVFEFPTRLLMRKTRLGRGMAATVVVLGTAVGVALLALVLLVPIVGAIRDFLKALPDLVADLRAQGELDWLGDTGAAGNVEEGAQNLAATIPESISALLGVAGRAFSAGLTLFTIVFLALFLVVDLPRLRGALASMLMPRNADRALDTWERITHTVSRWAIGAAVIAVIAGTVQGTTAYILGSSYALALGLIAGLLDLIPNLGATIAGFILVPAVYAEEGLTAALVMLAVVLVYQQIENNLLTPTIMGKAVDISAFFVILGVTVFGALLGVLGALVAVPVSASIQIVVREVTKSRRARVAAAREAETAGAAVEAPGGPVAPESPG
jgi:predicted PurR-regulated permease PerM